MFYKIVYFFGKPIVYLFFCLFYSFRVYGQQNIPKKGGVLIVSNHQSFFDPILISLGSMRRVQFVARKSLFKNKYFGILIRFLRAIPIERGKTDMKAMREIISRLTSDSVILIFPEGTRTSNGSIGRIKSGVSLISRRAVVPVVPAIIDGAFKAWPRQNLIFKFFSPIKMKFGQPIYPKELKVKGSSELIFTEMYNLRESI